MQKPGLADLACSLSFPPRDESSLPLISDMPGVQSLVLLPTAEVVQGLPTSGVQAETSRPPNRCHPLIAREARQHVLGENSCSACSAKWGLKMKTTLSTLGSQCVLDEDCWCAALWWATIAVAQLPVTPGFQSLLLWRFAKLASCLLQFTLLLRVCSQLVSSVCKGCLLQLRKYSDCNASWCRFHEHYLSHVMQGAYMLPDW